MFTLRLLFLCGAGLMVGAQAPVAGPIVVSGAQTPLRIEVSKPAVAGRPFNYVIANAAGKPIAAAIVAIDFFDANGTREAGPTQITAISLAPDEPGLAPGRAQDVRVTETFVMGPAKARVAPARAELRADYVVFMDNSTWGPNQAKGAAQLLAMRQGAAMERLRLAGVLKSAGPAALLARLGPLAR